MPEVIFARRALLQQAEGRFALFCTQSKKHESSKQSRRDWRLLRDTLGYNACHDKAHMRKVHTFGTSLSAPHGSGANAPDRL